jgi:uncharacterized protein
MATELRLLFRAIEKQDYSLARDQLLGEWWNLWLSKDDPNIIKNKDGETPLYRAALKGNKAIFKLLIDVKADLEAPYREGSYQTALHQIASGDNEIAVKLLLDAKANLNARESDGTTPLHYTAYHGNEVIFRLLLSAKANPKAESRYGTTVLMAASSGGNEAICKIVLAAKVDPNATEQNGGTALYKAAGKCNESVVRLLLAAKADPTTKVDEGTILSLNRETHVASRIYVGVRTVLDLANENGNRVICSLLQDAIKERGFVKQDGRASSSSSSSQQTLSCDPDLIADPLQVSSALLQREPLGRERQNADHRFLIQTIHNLQERVRQLEKPQIPERKKEETEPGEKAVSEAKVASEEKEQKEQKELQSNEKLDPGEDI